MSLVYRGTSSDDVKFNVTERRVYNAPAFDVTGIEVPGRSGDVLNSQERFKNKSVVYTGFIRSSDFPGDTTWERLSRGLRTIKAWICGDAGKYHDLTDDYDPGFVRRAFVSGETAISEVLDRPDGATITITFMAVPFMYEESDPIELPETGTASGAIASFEGVAAPLQSLKFNIEPSQDLHGYSYPWPGGGGKNKLNYDAWKSLPITNGTAVFENNGVTLTATSDGCYTAYAPNAGFPADAKIPVTEGQTIMLSWTTPDTSAVGRVYIFPNGAASGAVNVLNNYDTKLKYTVAAGVTFVTFRFGVSYSGTTIHFNNIQIEIGSTATAWRPYSNISPISGWSQVDGWQTGFNAWNEEWEVGGYSSSTGNKITQNNTIRSKNQFAVAPNTSYYFNAPYSIVDYGIWLFFYDSAGVYHKSFQHIYTASFTTPQDAAYMTFELSAAYGTTYNNDVSVNHPATDHSYHAYNGAKTEFPLGRTIGEGYLKPLTGQLHESKRLMNLSDLTWQYNATYHIGYTYVPGKANGRTNFITSICKTVDKGYATMVNGEAAGTAGDNGINIRLDSTTDLASFQAAIADETILFDLATPQDYSLTPVSVSSLLGQNNIWCNTGDTEVVYVEPTENPTEWPSKPRLEITMAGAGTLTVNGKTWSIGSYTGTLICDSEIMDWYDASNLKNSLVSGDGFPEFQPGENVITYTGGITKVVAKPRWRTL